jgi:hypothetical protein
MNALTQRDMIDMYAQQVAQMQGGRRRAPPRRRGGALVGGEGFDAIPDLFQADRPSAALDGYVLGSGLVGGRRRKKPTKMSAATKAYLAARKKMAAPRPPARRRRGGALVGGSKSMQDAYYELVDSGRAPSEYELKLMQAGIQPESRKDQLIRQIRNLEKKMDIGASTEAKLRKYTTSALAEILQVLKDNTELLAYPPTSRHADLYDDDRFAEVGYLTPPRRAAQEEYGEV